VKSNFPKEMRRRFFSKRRNDALHRGETMKVFKIIDSGIPILGGILFLFTVIITFLQIILREFFDFSLNWSDEITQFCITWIVLFGSIWATKNNQHLNVGVKLHQKLNSRQALLIDSVLEFLIAIVAAVAAYRGAIYSFSSMNTEALSISWMKMGYVFIALPIAMMTLCYYHLKSFFKNVWLIFKKN
jgi:TRAP-type C4-dicarboxylate transport system permease small subunit